MVKNHVLVMVVLEIPELFASFRNATVFYLGIH